MILADNLKLSKKFGLATWWVLLLIVLLGCSASDEPKIEALTGLSMGTSYTVKWVNKEGEDRPEVSQGVANELRRIEDSMSTYMDTSDLSGFNGAKVNLWHAIPAEMAALVAQSLSLSEKTNGAFDITIGPLVDLWGFGPQPIPAKIPSQDALDALRPVVGYQLLQVRQQPPAMRKLAPSTIDLSAIAKGYGVDAVALWLEAHGINNYLVEKFGSFEYFHYTTVLLKKLYSDNPKDKIARIYVNINKSYLNIIVFNGKELNYYNTFDYESKDDILYFILFVIEQNKLINNETKMKLIGEEKIIKNYYNYLSKFIKNLEMKNTEYDIENIVI